MPHKERETPTETNSQISRTIQNIKNLVTCLPTMAYIYAVCAVCVIFFSKMVVERCLRPTAFQMLCFLYCK